MFGHHDKHCMTCFSSFKTFFCLLEARNVCQSHVCVMAKLTNSVLDRQFFKCLPNNACSFAEFPGFYTNFNKLSTSNFIPKIAARVLYQKRCVFEIFKNHMESRTKNMFQLTFFENDIQTLDAL